MVVVVDFTSSKSFLSDWLRRRFELVELLETLLRCWLRAESIEACMCAILVEFKLWVSASKKSTADGVVI